MFRNYVVNTFRIFRKQKGYSLITLSGLAIGMTCFILISFYARYELSYDRFHENHQNIYRVIADTGEVYRGKSQVAVTPASLAAAMQDAFPEVLNTTKVKDRSVTMKYRGNRLAESQVYYVDPAFLEIFDFSLQKGNPETALDAPYNLLISRDMADKYFGSSDPLGETVSVDGIDHMVTGVLENIPGNTHFRFDYLASFSSLVESSGKDRIIRWNNWSYYTFVKIHGEASSLAVEQKLPDLLKQHSPNATQVLRLQPVADVHLHNDANFELESPGDISNIYLLSAIGIFILLIACFNFMNLSTARATIRAKEVGLRKVIGAGRLQLVRQFLGESLFFAFLSLVISLSLVKLLLPSFRLFVQRELETGFILDTPLLLTLAGLVFVVGIVSGSYPALALSSFQPISVLKGTQAQSSRGSSGFRSVLVVCQFTISAALIICTLVVVRQLHFMRDKELGFIKVHIVTIRNPEGVSDALKSDLLQNPAILDAALSDNLPHNITSASYGEWDSHDPEERFIVYRNWVDDDFLDFYDIPVILGRGFSQEYNDSTDSAYILNESAVKAMGWENPIGKRFGFDTDRMGVVVGVVRDFHFTSLHLDIGPLALTPGSENNRDWLSLRISPTEVPQTLTFIEETWKQHAPEGTFSYSFLDDRLDRMYRTESRLVSSFTIYTLIAIFVACLGLFGLASFATAQRTREIGIRKVLGASEWNITLLTTKKFVTLVLIANAVAAPIAYFAMLKWLQNYAYMTSINFWIFLFSAAISFVIALLTVGYQSIKAALADPVKSLRYE
jgi:putative ABC transport system permease protein